MALATAADVRLRLGISVSTYDTLIDALISDATAEMEMYCGRRLESATVTDEIGDGLGQPFLLVRRYPVTSVTSISLRNSDATYTTLNAADYAIRGDGGEGAIDRVGNSTWIGIDHPRMAGTFGGLRGGLGFNSYKITYEGGYKAGTHDTELAALRAIVCDIVAAQSPTQASAREERSVYQSENVGYQSWTYRPVSEVVSQFHDRLDRFRRIGL